MQLKLLNSGETKHNRSHSTHPFADYCLIFTCLLNIWSRPLISCRLIKRSRMKIEVYRREIYLSAIWEKQIEKLLLATIIITKAYSGLLMPNKRVYQHNNIVYTRGWLLHYSGILRWLEVVSCIYVTKTNAPTRDTGVSFTSLAILLFGDHVLLLHVDDAVTWPFLFVFKQTYR